MNLNKIVFTICLLTVITSTALVAQQRKYVNEYLNIGVGARGLGMSGAQGASVNDVTSPFWNPAGLVGVTSGMQIGIMHSEYFSSIAKYDYLGAAFPLKGRKGVLGFSVIRFAVDDIPYTINLVQPDGTIDYSKIRSISSADYAGLISYAKPITINRWAERDDIKIAIGGNAKIIHRSIGTMANAWGIGIDAGIQGTFGRWKVGANFKDITTTYTVWSHSLTEKEKEVFKQTGNEIVSRSSEVNRPRIVLGGGRLFPLNQKITLLAEANLDVSTDGARYGNLINANPFSIDPRLGVEAGYDKKVFLRAGVGRFQRILKDSDTSGTQKTTLFQPTLGLGVQIKSFAFDYAFSSLNLGDSPLYSHFISIRLDINKKQPSKVEKDINERVSN